MPPKKDTTNPTDLDASIQHTNLRLDDLILANRNFEAAMEQDNLNLTRQIGELDSSVTDRLQTGFAELSKQLTQQLSQQFAAMAATSSPSRSATPGIASSLLQPSSSENVVISTSFPLLHIPLPSSQPLHRNSPSTTQLSSPQPQPPPSFSPTQPTIPSSNTVFTTYTPVSFQPTNTSFQIPFSQPFHTAPTPSPFAQPNQFFPQSSNQNPHTHQPIRNPKIELGIFDGTDVLEWLFQSEQFFGFYNIPIENRLPMAAFYMKGEALSWYKWMFQSHQLTDWHNFARALELRFGPSTYENHQAQLFKLRQHGSVAEYQANFERLGNRVLGLPSEAILNCFISGLIPEIRNELAIHQPFSISQAVGLAKLIESKLKDLKPKFPKHNTTFHPPQSAQLPYHKNPNQTATPPNFNHTTTTTLNTQPAPNPPTPTNRFPIRRITAAQREERRAKGLCFNCDEKFIPGHRCTAGKFLLLMVDEDDTINLGQEDELLTELDITTEPEETYFQLSPQAVSGHFSPKTLKFKGIIDGLHVTVLIDTGSTHNILQPRIAKHLKIPTKSIPNFSVMVGNGSQLDCCGLCPQVPITLQNHLFFIPFYLLPIEGADVVLGMEWLRTLGPILADFSIPKLSFTYNNKEITITGDSKTSPTPSSYNQLCQLLHTDSVASIHLLIFQQTPDSPLNPDPPLTNPLDTLPQSLPPEIHSVLTSHASIFQPPSGLPPSRPHDHSIPLTPNTNPVNIKPYRCPHSQKEAMTTIINDMLQEGIIKPSNSPYSSPVLLVRKKDGSWRFCVDYRALNAITIPDRFPIPTIDELFDELGSASWFTKIDLRSGYHQIRVNPDDTHKTAFRTFDGHYEFLVMPFGLTNAPSTFQSAMNDLLRPYLRRFVLVFFDDILIYSSSLSDHVTHLQLILDLLSTNQFFAKLSKCVFAVPSVDYLGHIISSHGVTPDPSIIQAVLDWPKPRSLTTLRGFLGLTGFYRRFVRHYASHAAPLTDLLRFTKFKWSPEADTAFTTLKKKMTETPVLALPDFSKLFVLETDASAVAIGAVLSQDNHPLAFFSKKMCNRMQVSSVYVREMYAITEAVKKWRQYLIGRHFHIFTDQKSLKNLLVQTIQTPEQQKWAAKLQGFSFDIFYKPGKCNQVADALSRMHAEEEAILLSVSSPTPLILNQLRQYYTTDKQGQELIAKYNSDPHMQVLYKFKNNIMLYKDKIYIPAIPEMRQHLLHEFHSTPSAGHSGTQPTLARLSSSFNWPGVYKDVKLFVESCSICQRNKYMPKRKQGLLQPLEIPKQVWEEISMDFITHLPSSFGHTVIWVICDRLSKFVHFIALPTHFTSSSLATRFSSEVCRLHGIPISIVSDRDPLFLSAFWKELFRLQGTTLKHSTAYHPETDGQTEVVNRSLETYLRCFTNDQPRKWFKFLHLAELWYNTSFHSAIGMTPFEALYGRPPPTLLDYTTGNSENVLVDKVLTDRQEILDSLKKNLTRSREKMREQANKKRITCTFAAGDLVLLRLKQYRQISVHKRDSQKLSPRFFGPFRVLRSIGEVSYELDLPPSSKIHNVFHVSQLRRYKGVDPNLDFLSLPPETTSTHTSDTEAQTQLRKEMDGEQNTTTDWELPLQKPIQTEQEGLSEAGFVEPKGKAKEVFSERRSESTSSLESTEEFFPTNALNDTPREVILGTAEACSKTLSSKVHTARDSANKRGPLDPQRIFSKQPPPNTLQSSCFPPIFRCDSSLSPTAPLTTPNDNPDSSTHSKSNEHKPIPNAHLEVKEFFWAG
ncbi:uncharacterized protein LOC131662390 [Vicia villosa]|uniref:uncharacterized protein LOC131662390 n=1 Tax=Vicia villosa TaxID=3911 RepID=UPI00273AA68C|nr:uncharacterized protein LOC131662390 [Vicia villosa]